jgi:hypothetical protein
VEVNPNSRINSVRTVINAPPAFTRRTSTENQMPEFESSHALEAQLIKLPDIRVEKIEQARRLVGDPEYPPRETIRQIAALLALDDPETQGDE